MRARSLARFGAVALIAASFLAVVSSADAAHYQRPFKRVFGSAEQPSFGWDLTITDDRQTGDVLVADYSTQTIYRYHADGTPAPFGALGSNALDGKEANGKPCSEEPASCDKTPIEGLELGDASNSGIAIDESSGPAKGDIYVTAANKERLLIFSAEGEYLGQLTEHGTTEFGATVVGVAVDQSGAVYVSASVIYKYVPTGKVVAGTDLKGTFPLPVPGHFPHSLAVGSGPTEGTIFTNVGGNGYQGLSMVNEQTGEAKEFAEGYGGTEVAVDPKSGTLLAGNINRTDELAEFEVPAGSEPVRVSRIVSGEHGVYGVAVNSASEVLIGEGPQEPHIRVFGLPGIVPTVTTESAANVIGTKATLQGSVNPSEKEVTGCFFEYGETTQYGSKAPCEGSLPLPVDSSDHPLHADLTGLEPNGHVYHFRLVAENANGVEEGVDQTFTTAYNAVTEAATGVGDTTATLNGTVRPEGSQFSSCAFEYGLATSFSYEHTVACEPTASALPGAGDYSPHPVKAVLTGLAVGATYRFRLVTTNGFGTVEGEELRVGTFGPPRIGEVRALNAGKSTVSLEARVNPSGFGTNYRFEWGPTSTYGHVAPVEYEPFLGGGTEAALVKVNVTGLTEGSTYHYRVVATNAKGTTATPDSTFETLNLCGLADGRCFELVSRGEAGPIAIPGEQNAHVEMHFQAATAGPGGLAYPVEGGYPEATKGADVLYRALYGPSGWQSTQLSPPIKSINERSDVASQSSATKFLADDLSCGFVEDYRPLTEDPSMKLEFEAGGSNLYRIEPDNTYTGVTKLAPENPLPEFDNYAVAGASQNCDKVVFTSQLHYPGVAAVGQFAAYEWENGTLRSLGFVPGPGGEEIAVNAKPGNSGAAEINTENAVSEDGSRVFFAAERQTSPDQAEIGAQGIFVREGGTRTRDVSLSQTETPDTGATYQWATADGSKVFFTANAGLTEDSNAEGTDLYEYDLATGKLADRSITKAAGGAQVAGFVGAAADGSKVYFTSRNQLVPGSGNSRLQNERQGTYSIFGETGTQITFVGTITERDQSTATITDQAIWTSQVSPDGRYLLFQSSGKVTGYESGGAAEAYLYDSAGGSEGTVCVSCRQDGKPSIGQGPENKYGVSPWSTLPRDSEISNELHPPRFLTMQGGEPHVFFASPDALAPGAVEGQNNVYEWAHDQVFRLVSAAPGSQEIATPGRFAVFGGASDDGANVYLITPETLTWEDGDMRQSAYDARIGGGHPKPGSAASPCDALAEHGGSCQGPGQAAPVVPGTASETFTGPGSSGHTKQAKNPAKKKPKKHKKKKHGRKKHAKKAGKKKGKGKRARRADGNGKAGK